MATPWLIVGAGLTGATLAERIASVLGQRVLVIDRRPHVAGNAFDEHDERGHLVHRYGPHIFHTNSERVWAYLSRFTRWRPYEHRVRAVIDGVEVPLPFNLTSIERLFPTSVAARYTAALRAAYGDDTRVPILRLREDANPTLQELAEFIYEKVFLGYTTKQWGLRPDELDASVTGRVPVLIGRDDRYFQDMHQGLPVDGYTRMVTRMLTHPNIEVGLGTDFKEAAAQAATARVIFTGPIDEYFGHAAGHLPYRSLRFEFRHDDAPVVQSVGTVNYPGQEPFTRITEMKHLTGQETAGTTLVKEFPTPHVPAVNDPYYPIPSPASRELHRRYQALAARADGVLFAGRLGDYKYYNMDQAVARALSLFDQIAS